MKTVAIGSKRSFFYDGGGRSKVLNQIHHCIRFSPGVIALTGATGSGRSLMIHALVDSCNQHDTDVCLLSEDSAVLETEEELFRALALGFGLEEKPIEILEDLVDRVQHFIEVGLHNKRAILIVIDDIKQHSDEVLDALLQLVSSIKGLTLLLTGEPSLVEILKQFHVQSILIHQIALRPLLAEEAFDFLHEYLLQRGVSVETVLNQKKIDEMMSKTGGNPALLVREAQQLVSVMQLKNSHGYKNIPVTHIIALIAVVILTVLAFWYYPTPDEVIHDTETPAKNTTIEPQVINPEMNSSAIVESITGDNTVQKQQKIVEDESLRSLQDDELQADRGYTRYEQELLNRPAGNITLQVLSLSSEQKAKSYIEQSTLTDKNALSYYRRGTANNMSYVVLYGDYPDKRMAMQVQNMLPKELKKSAPWPRPIIDIQRELKQRQQ